MIMSTLAELEEGESIERKIEKIEISDTNIDISETQERGNIYTSEKQFYENIREKILVLFEGFQAPNNKNLESKIDLTLNFLEYLLATIDERLENIDINKK